MEGKKTAGRQKIPLAKIEREADRYSTFSKRRFGLYKKASELVREYDIDLGIIISSPTGKPHSFFHPTTYAVINRFMNPTTELSVTEQLLAACARNNINQDKDRLNEFDTRENATNKKIHFLDQTKEIRDKGWWESIDQLNSDDIIKFEAWLNCGEFMMNYQLKQLQSGVVSFLQSQLD
ncbi:unnamed protein product [Withania somnifera]